MELSGYNIRRLNVSEEEKTFTTIGFKLIEGENGKPQIKLYDREEGYFNYQEKEGDFKFDDEYFYL